MKQKFVTVTRSLNLLMLTPGEVLAGGGGNPHPINLPPLGGGAASVKLTLIKVN